MAIKIKADSEGEAKAKALAILDEMHRDDIETTDIEVTGIVEDDEF
jgi:hypothetical protein